ncbi:MAG: ATP-binding protein [Gammaproteobacteria bacterium]
MKPESGMLNQILQEKIQTLPNFTEKTFSELEARFLALLTHAEFKIQTLCQARQLAFHLSYLCPNPARTAVGLTELFINAIEHGNLGITFEEKNQLTSESAWFEEIERRLNMPANQSKMVHITVHKDAHAVQFEIQDEGLGFRWQEYLEDPSANQTAKHGRGIILARMMSFDKLEYNETGNYVRCLVGLHR